MVTFIWQNKTVYACLHHIVVYKVSSNVTMKGKENGDLIAFQIDQTTIDANAVLKFLLMMKKLPETESGQILCRLTSYFSRFTCYFGDFSYQTTVILLITRIFNNFAADLV